MSENTVIAPHPLMLTATQDLVGNYLVDNAGNLVLSIPTLYIRMNGTMIDFPVQENDIDTSLPIIYTMIATCNGKTYRAEFSNDQEDVQETTEIGTFVYGSHRGRDGLYLNLRKLREFGEIVSLRVSRSISFSPLYDENKLPDGTVISCWNPAARYTTLSLDGWIGDVYARHNYCGMGGATEDVTIDFIKMTATMTVTPSPEVYPCEPICITPPPDEPTEDICAPLMWCRYDGATVYTESVFIGEYIWLKAWNPDVEKNDYPELKIVDIEEREYITIKPETSVDDFKDNNGYTVRFWRNIYSDMMTRYPVQYVWHHGSPNGADRYCTNKDVLFVTDSPKFDSAGNFDPTSNTGVIYQNADRRERPPAEDAQKCSKDDPSNIVSNGVSWRQGEIQWLTHGRDGNPLYCNELLTPTGDSNGDYRKYRSRNYTVWFIPQGDTNTRNHHCYFDTISWDTYVDYAIEFYHKGIYFELNGKRYLYTGAGGGYYVFSDIYKAWSPSPCVSVDIDYDPVYTDDAMSQYYMYKGLDFTTDGAVISNASDDYMIKSNRDVEYYSLAPRTESCPIEPEPDEEFE